MNDRQNYLVSNERAGLRPKQSTPTSALRRFMFVTGALASARAKFDDFARHLGDRDDEDVVHPIDPVGSVDPQRVDDYLTPSLKRHAGILIGMCAASAVPGSRVQIVEHFTIKTAKRRGRKVALLFQDTDHLVASPTTEDCAGLVDIVVLNDVMFAASAAKSKAVAKELFPNAEVLIALTSYGGNAARTEIDRLLGVPAE